MAILEIFKYPDPVLKKIASPVQNIGDKTVQLVNDMLETMYAAPGVGLAAPQVGVSQRVVVLDTDHENPGQQVYKLINPVITHAEGEVIWEEGCLSVVVAARFASGELPSGIPGPGNTADSSVAAGRQVRSLCANKRVAAAHACWPKPAGGR